MNYRIVLADRQRLFRQSLGSALALEPDFQVVAEAEDGSEAVRCVCEHKPDLVFMDVSMPKLDGPDALQWIKRDCPSTRSVILTDDPRRGSVRRALKAGADGYVLKGASLQELVLAARSVLLGYAYLSPEVCLSVIKEYLAADEVRAVRSDYESLSQREREVFKLIAEGHRTKEIAALLGICPKTVENQRTSLIKKLGIRSVSGLTVYAIELGLRAPKLEAASA
jgi:DNA-binding NarL/FixJ family response regulator